jgi:hypothetical protein
MVNRLLSVSNFSENESPRARTTYQSLKVRQAQSSLSNMIRQLRNGIRYGKLSEDEVIRVGEQITEAGTLLEKSEQFVPRKNLNG